MALYENLPVYKAAYDLLLDSFRMCKNLERDFRYTIGEKLKQDIMDIMVDIYKANATTEKTSVLASARERLVVVKLQIRLLRDLKQISIKTFALQSEKAELLSIQLAAWHKSSFYLGAFDNYMKREEGIKYYGRYVDDFIVVHNDKLYLRGLMYRIEKNLKEHLGLTLHPNKRYLQHVSKGFEFLGMKQRRSILIPGKRMKHNMMKVVYEYCSNTKLTLDYKQIKSYRAQINSYLGLLRHSASARLRNDIREILYSAPTPYLLVDSNFEKAVINRREIVSSLVASI